MKIVVISHNAKKGKTYDIQVMDGNTLVHSESANNIKQRDEYVWKLADLYNAIDIEMVDEEMQDKFKQTEIPSIPVLEEDEADEFFEENREWVYDRILQAIDEGIELKRDNIRLFELNGTGVYITSNREDWKNGLESAIEYYVGLEKYEKCIVAKQLMNKL